MVYTRADMKAGLTPPDPNVRSGLQIGGFTLQERQDYNVWILQQRPLDELEARSIGYRENEIEEYFHPKTRYEVVPLEGGRYKLVPVTEKIEPLTEKAMEDAIVKIEIDAFNRKRVSEDHVRLPKISGFDKVKARTMGFTGDICMNCGGVQMVKNGNCLLCTSCGNTSGCS
jgi:hypothetical protein